MKVMSIMVIALFILSSQIRAQTVSKDLNRNAEEKVTYSTNLDFDSTMIDGQMKAPTGFFLQGRNRQSLSNMVKLRSNFQKRLGNSKSAVKAMVR